MSRLTGLTRLSICSDNLSALAPLAALRQLENLQLAECQLAAVPEQLSVLTALMQLILSYNNTMVGGWQNLRTLTRLRDLYLAGVPLPDGVPSELERLFPDGLRF